MKVISVVNQKGGCGKTTLAVNIAAALARTGNKTLLIDLDPQAHATYALGYTKKAAEQKTSYDIFKCFIEKTKVVYDELIINDRGKLHFIPSNMLLSAAEINLGGINGAAAILSRSLFEVSFDTYRYVIIDSPPSFGFLTLNSMYAADMILVPIDLSYFSFNGVTNIHRVTGILEKETNRKPETFFILNIYDSRTNFAKTLNDEAGKLLGEQLLATKVRASVRLREAAKLGKTIFEHDPKSSSALDFYNLTSEIVNVCEKEVPVSKVKEEATVENEAKAVSAAYSSDTDVNGVETQDVEVSVAQDRAADMNNVIVKEFALHAPQAGAVYILGDFNGWQKIESNRLTKLEDGTWAAKFNIEKGKYRYKYLVDDRWMQDPNNPEVEANRFGSVDSVLNI